MKKIVILLLLVICCFPQLAHADTQSDLDEQINNSLGNLDFSAVEGISSNYIGSIVEKIKQIIAGKYDSAQSFLSLLASLFAQGLKGIFPQLISIFAVLVLVGLVRQSSGGFISQSTSEMVSFVGVAVVLLSVITLVVPIFGQINGVISQIAALADASMPILLTLVIANGSNTLSAVCQPSMLMFSQLIIQLVRTVILPITICGIVFSFVSNLSANLKVSKMSSFLNNSASWLLGIVFTVFSAFTTVQSISAATIDGVSYRMAKFTAKNYIPILGGYVSDGFDIIVASTSLIKNAFGVVLLLILAMIVIKPLVSIFCVNLGLQAISAISEPIVDSSCIKIFSSVSKSLTFLIALVVAVAFMFSILIFVAISCANGV